MDINTLISCFALFIVVAIVFAVAKFFLKMTGKIISLIITIIVALGLLAILFIFIL